MIRSKFAFRLALLGAMGAPGFAVGQDAKPPESTPAVEEVAKEAREKVGVEKAREAVIQFQGKWGDEGAKPGRGFIQASRLRHPMKMNAAKPFFGALQDSYGLELVEVDETLRAQIAIPPAQGVVVVAVKPGSLAEQAGLKPNDVLLSLGEDRLRGVNQARGQILALRKEAVETRLIRAGKEMRLSLVGPEHGAGWEPGEYWIGVPVAAVDATLRSHLTALPAEAGLIVNDVVPDSPAAKAGVKKNDILVKLGDKPLKDSASMVEQVQAAGEKSVPLELFRAGKPITVTITPIKRTRPLAFDVPGHRSWYFYNFVMPKPGVEITIDPKQYELMAKQVKEANKLIESQAKKIGARPLDLQIEMLLPKATLDEANARIEAGMKEMKSSIDELKKLVETLKKPESK